VGWKLLLATATLAAALAAAATSVAQDAKSTAGPDSGVFLIQMDNKRVGTEKFQIKRGPNGWEASGELQLDGEGGAKISETATLRVDTALVPISYEREQKSPKAGKLEVEFASDQTKLAAATSGGEPEEQEFVLPLDELVVLDTNFFHHYELLLFHFDRAKGGAQPFNVFIPQEALPGTINLQFVAKEEVPAGPAAKQLDHFQAVTDEVQIDIWATPEGAIQRLSIPQAKLEVVRQ